MILIFAAILPALAVSDAPPDGAVKLPVPRVQYRVNEASATTSPWIDANGWRIARTPDKNFYYDVPANAAALAAAEAFAYGAKADVHTDSAGTESFHRMVEFLRGIPDETNLPVMANIGVIDDGSSETGELMNLLSRHNLLYKIVPAPDPHLDINIRLGSKEYPKADAADPSFLAQKIRGQLGDEKRLLRLYGSEVVVARMLGDRDHVRLHILDYATRPVPGLRLRVLGSYSRQTIRGFDRPDLKLEDVNVANGATEFTIPEMSIYAVIDLSR